MEQDDPEKRQVKEIKRYIKQHLLNINQLLDGGTQNKIDLLFTIILNSHLIPKYQQVRFLLNLKQFVRIELDQIFAQRLPIKYKESVINQYLVSKMNSPFLFKNDNTSFYQINQFIALSILIESEWIQILDDMIIKDIKSQIFQTSGIIQNKIINKIQPFIDNDQKELLDKDVFQLLNIYEKDEEYLNQLIKRRVNSYDKCLQLQLEAQIINIENQQTLNKVKSPDKLLIANNQSVQKQIEKGLEKFKILANFKEQLKQLSLQIYEKEEQLLDEILQIEEGKYLDYKNPYCIQCQETFQQIQQKLIQRLNVLFDRDRNKINFQIKQQQIDILKNIQNQSNLFEQEMQILEQEIKQIFDEVVSNEQGIKNKLKLTEKQIMGQLKNGNEIMINPVYYNHFIYLYMLDCTVKNNNFDEIKNLPLKISEIDLVIDQMKQNQQNSNIKNKYLMSNFIQDYIQKMQQVWSKQFQINVKDNLKYQ